MTSKGTPPRAIRLNDDLWNRTKEAGNVYDRSPSEVVRVALETWLDNPTLPDDWQPTGEDIPQ